MYRSRRLSLTRLSPQGLPALLPLGWSPLTAFDLRGDASFSGVLAVAVTPHNARIVTGSRDHTARIWDAGTGAELMVLKGHGDSVSSVAVTPDGSRIVTGSVDNTARVWDADTGAELLAVVGPIAQPVLHK